MKEFLGEEELSVEQAANIARAMWHVAEAEKGVHQHEREMIDGFYHGCCAEKGTEPEEISAHPWDPAEALRLLNTASLREMLLRSCLLLGYADGEFSPAERALVEQIARQLEVPGERLESIDREVKRVLLSQFEDVTIFRDATYDIGKHLGMSRAEVDAVLDEHA